MFSEYQNIRVIGITVEHMCFLEIEYDYVCLDNVVHPITKLFKNADGKYS